MAQNGGQLVGERLGKEYRDRYARFSMGKHFEYGTQDGAKMTSQKTAFSPPRVGPHNKDTLNANIRSMRGSHFSI